MNLHTEKKISPNDLDPVLAPHQFVEFHYNTNTGIITLGQDNALQYDVVRLDESMGYILLQYLKELYEHD